MSQRHSKDDKRTVSSKHLPVASKCLAIVLLPQKKHGNPASHDVNKDREVSAVNSGNPTTSKNVPPVFETACNGKEILEDFKRQNKTCYWNPALIESIRQLEYLGFVEPCTVLVSGEDIHLENLRSAWGRRVLKAPNNFTIDRIGDVNGIEMQVIPQTQFIPLPDSLCLIIAELNKGDHLATLESIRARLQRWYSNTNLPSHQLIYDTLGQLIRERKVFHNGSGYCVVTPEMYHLPATTDPTLACTASWLPYHPMYIPVFPPQQQHPPYKAPTRSISCQVTQIEDKPSSDTSHQQGQKKKIRPRSHSVRACRGKDKAQEAEKENADFKRATSTRFRTEKAKAMTKDLNLKTSNINQDKDKGEKTTLFSKLFGRKKKKSASAGTATASTSSGAASQSTEAEFATFSAQFPPPEWLWYQQQLERQRRTEEWVSQQLPKSATWGHFNAGRAVPSSGIAEGGSLETALTETSHPYYTQRAAYHNQHPPLRSQGHVYATLSHMQGFSGSDGMRAAREEDLKIKQQHRLSGSQTRKSHGHHHHHQRDHHHQKYRDHRKTLQENNYDVPVSQAPPHQVRTLGANPRMDLSPYSLEEENIYSTPGLSKPGQSAPWHSTPCYDVPAAQFGSVAMPSHILHSTTLQQEPSDVGKMQPLVNPHHQRRGHRSKRHTHKSYSVFDTSAGNDISIEYKGRMPKKNSTVVQSRDSGVNCMGLLQNRQRYLEDVSQEASAYLPSRMEQTISSTVATASSHHPGMLSTQRGTPYTSLDQHDPEGNGYCQQQPVTNSSCAETNGDMSPNSDGPSHRDSGPSGASAGGEDERERVRHHEQQGDFPQFDERSECEGVSHNTSPHYMTVGSDAVEMTTSPDTDTSPQYVAMSYCDSSIGEEGAGGGEVLLCQAEINQFKIPQLVLDTESRLDCGSLSVEPDIALSSAGSKDTLDRTADESERSVETVVRSPKYDRVTPTIEETPSSSMVLPDRTLTAGVQAELCMVNALGSELQGMGVVDSGSDSPRSRDHEKQQHHIQLQLDKRTHQSYQPIQNAPLANEGFEKQTTTEHKSKHERIKAFVKQSNQLLEQRQFTGHGIAPFAGSSVPNATEPDIYANYPPPNSHPHFTPFPKPVCPAGQHQQQSVLLNNQKNHHHHHHQSSSQQGGMKDRSKPQNVWPGQGQGHGQSGEKLSSNELKIFQEQQLKGKKFGLNGEFEVVGVV